MIGLEIRINDEDPITVASDNLVFVNLLHGYSSDRIMVMGSDLLHYLTWFDGRPEVGDKVLIRIVDTDKVAPVLTMKDCDRYEIKQWYEWLKVELQEKGLI